VWELECEELTVQVKDQIVDATNGLHGLIQHFNILLFSHTSELGVLTNALEQYLEKHNTQESEQLLAVEAEKHNVITQELEAAKAEIQGPKQLPSITFLNQGLLSILMRADTLSISETESNSP